ncbi:CPBP family intramembrane glutamic endopeptidase [Promicromonospora soli]
MIKRAWATAAPWVAVAVVPVVYGMSRHPMVAWAALLLMIIAAASATSNRPGAAWMAAVFGIALVPTVLGWPLLTPAVGAVLLVLIAAGAKRRELVRSPGVLAWCIGGAVAAAVVVFAFLWSPAPTTAGFGWDQSPLPRETSAILLSIIASSLANSVFEEFAWRVALVDLRLHGAPHRLWWLVYISAAFGVSHIHGLPGGMVGVGVTFLFALAMALVREASRGSIVACVAIHAVADAVLLWRSYV